MQFEFRQRIAPPGRYRAVLTGIEPITGPYGKAAIEFTSTVADGPHKGAELVKITGTDPRPNVELGKLIGQLYGREVEPGEKLDVLADLVGKQFDVFATLASGGGGSIIQSVRPANQP